MAVFDQKAKSNPSSPSAFNSRKGEDFFGVQAKLNVGKSNDKYEVEADHVADKIVSNNTTKSAEPFFSSSTSKNQATQIHKKENTENEIQEKPLAESITPVTHLQPIQKCDCDKENVQKKEEDESQNDTPNPNFERQLNSSKGGGTSLSKNTQTEMESGFGTDFSNVRIHNDSNAVQMSEEIGAQAFANGNDIYFNEGKYDPNSQSGKHLLAHELTHTVQQGKSKAIQKATDPNFAVTGLSDMAGGTTVPNSIFFEMGSSAVNTEEPKLDTLAANSTQNYDLEGFASEEGSDSLNQLVAQQRINSVSNMLRDKGHIGMRNPINSFSKGNGRINYRDMRKVEVRNANDASSEPNCNVTTANPTPAVTNCGTSFTTAHPIALSQATSAHSSMAGATGPERTRIEDAVRFFFGDVSHYTTILEHLRKHVLQVADQTNTVTCHNSCDSTCAGAVAYMPGGTGIGQVLTICLSFINNPNLDSRVTTLLHEAFHVVPGLGTTDQAYDAERGFTLIDPAVALTNTDTYVAFIKEINTPGSVIGGSSSRDIIDASIAGPELTNLRRVMAFLEKWVIESTAETSSLYDTIIEARGLRSWTGVGFPYYEDSMVFVSRIFGLTAPSAPPLERDQVAVAGIYHRLMAMDDFLWQSNIAINKDNTVPAQFANGPGEPLLVNDTFLASGQHNMAFELVAKLVEANDRIAASEKAKYIEVIEEIRVHAGLAAP
jgi:outer membrane protein OmpA-like peptidoglycan-associated protein